MSKDKNPLVPIVMAVVAAGSAGYLWVQRGKRSNPSPNIAVYIVGEVHRPGVVSVPRGSRVVQAIEKAGGLTDLADPLSINLAQKLTDEQKVVIPPKPTKVELPQNSAHTPPDLDTPDSADSPEVFEPTEVESQPPMVEEFPEPPPDTVSDSTPPPGDPWEGGEVLELPDPTAEVAPPGEEMPAVVTGKKINLNQATVEQLQELPGVGPGLAARIVGYRKGTREGRFEALEDLVNVPGIKLKKLEQIRPYLTL